MRQVWPVLLLVLVMGMAIYGVYFAVAQVYLGAPGNGTWSTNGSISLFCAVQTEANHDSTNITNVSLWTNMTGAWTINQTATDPILANGTSSGKFNNGTQVQFNLSGLGTARGMIFAWTCNVTSYFNNPDDSINSNQSWTTSNTSRNLFGVDKTAPVLTLKNPVNGGYLNSTAGAYWEITLREHNKNASGASFYYRRGTSGSFQPFKTMDCMQNVNTTYEDTYNCSIVVDMAGELGVSDGDTIQFYLNASDLANNTGSSGTSTNPWSVTVDTVKPLLNSFNISTLNWVTGTSSSTSFNVTFNVSDRSNDTCVLYTNTSGSLGANYSQHYFSNITTNFNVIDPNGFIIPALGNGIYNFSISCNDSAANYFTFGRNLTIAVDNQPPNVSLSAPTNMWKLKATSVWINFTPSDNMNLTKAVSPFTGAYAQSGNDSCELWTNITGTWMVNTTSTNLGGFVTNGSVHSMRFNVTSDGDYLWAVQCNDSAGNRNSTMNYTITFDTTAPVVNSINETFVNWNTRTTRQPMLNFTINASDANNQTCFVYHNLSGSVAINVSVNYSSGINVSFPEINLSGIGSTVVNVTFECNDSSGNLGYYGSNFSFLVDTEAPNVTLSGNHTRNGWFSTRSISVQFEPVDNMNNTLPASSVTNTVVSGGNQSCELWTNMTGSWEMNTTANNKSGFVNYGGLHNYTFSLTSDGIYYWNVRCNDTAGNAAYATNNGTLKIDTVTPVLTSVNPSNGSVFSSGTSTLFQVSVAELNVNVTYHTNTTLWFRRMGTSNWRGSNLTCYGTAPSYTCNNTVDTSNIILNGETMEYYFTVSDMAGNTGTNGSSTNPLTSSADTQAPNINASNSSQIDWRTMTANTRAIVFRATATDAAPDKCFAYTNMTGSWAANLTSATTFASGSEVTLSTITFSNDGVYSYALACNDTGGNTNYSSSNLSFTIDTTAPTVSISGPGNNTWTNDSVVSFQFTPVDNFNRSNLTTAGNQSCKVWSNFTGSWMENSTDTNYTGFVNALPNNITLTFVSTADVLWNVRCNDSSGNAGVSSDNYTVKVDFTNPTINWVNATSVNWHTRSVSSRSVTFTFNATDVHLNTCTLRHNATGTLANNMTETIVSDANSSIGPVNLSSDGVYNFQVNCDDSSGRSIASSIQQLTIDTGTPAVTATYPSNNTFVNSSSVQFQFIAIDSMNSSNSTSDGNNSCELWTNMTGAWEMNKTMVWSNNNGTYMNFSAVTFSNTSDILWGVSCNDTAKNLGSISNMTLKVDFEDPYVSLVNASQVNWDTKNTVNKSILFSFNGSDKHQNTCTLRHNATGSMANNMTVSFTTGANTTVGPVNFTSEGVYTFSVRCDDSGGRSNESLTSTFYIDTSAPNVTASYPSAGYRTGTTSVPFRFTALDNFNSTSRSDAGNQSCELWTNMTGAWQLNTTFNYYNDNGTAINVSPVTFASGVYNYSITCNDTAGNRGSFSNLTFTVDTSTPKLINWTYNESSRLLTLGFDEIMDTSTFTGSRISFNYSDGSNADGLASIDNANATPFNSTSVFVTLTYGQDAAVKKIQRNDPSARANITLNGGAVKDLSGNNNAVNNSQPNKYIKSWHESPSWPSSLTTTLTIPRTSTLESWGWSSGSTNNWNISDILSIGGLGSNYNVVYYNVDGTDSGWRVFSRTNWVGSTLQYINNTNDKEYQVNITSGSPRFELCCRTLT
ncbi:hypothetical protein HYU11_02730 [Candidatus Woesearchaeota archaeon]|nr:hypothetical protein [Candidatus Woesearchaeota archaeon]